MNKQELISRIVLFLIGTALIIRSIMDTSPTDAMAFVVAMLLVIVSFPSSTSPSYYDAKPTMDMDEDQAKKYLSSIGISYLGKDPVVMANKYAELQAKHSAVVDEFEELLKDQN